MPFFSRHRRLPSFDKENTAAEGGFTAIVGDFTLGEAANIGLSLGENNQILKIDGSSPLCKKFRVGDIIVAVNGKDCSSMSVHAMLEHEAHVELTALRRHANSSVRSPTDRSWAGY